MAYLRSLLVSSLFAISLAACSASQDINGNINRAKEGCENGIARDCTSLGAVYATGYGVDIDFEKARGLFELGCDGRDIEACDLVAKMYTLGIGGQKEPEKAASLFKLTCDAGRADDCWNLAILYLYGEGVEQDFLKSSIFFSRACNLGDKRACRYSAQLLAMINYD